MALPAYSINCSMGVELLANAQDTSVIFMEDSARRGICTLLAVFGTGRVCPCGRKLGHLLQLHLSTVRALVAVIPKLCITITGNPAHCAKQPLLLAACNTVGLKNLLPDA